MTDMRSALSQIGHLRAQLCGLVQMGCAEPVGTDMVAALYWQVTDNPPWRAISHSHQRHGRAGAAASEQLKTISSIRLSPCAMVRPDHPLADRAGLRMADRSLAHTIEPPR